MTADRRTLGGHRRAIHQVTGIEIHVPHTAWPDSLQTGINLLIYKNSSPTSENTECFLQNDQFVNVVWGEKKISRYSDSLRPGRSGDRIPVGARFSAPLQTGPGAHLASCKLVPSLFPGVKAAGAWRWPPTPSSKSKVKRSRYKPAVAQRVCRGIALLFHDRGTRRGWVVSSTPRPHFTPGKDPVSIL